VIRVPATGGEEGFAMQLLDAERILVYPGYFFDFSREAYVIVSLLVAPERFGDAMTRLFRAVPH
jgi:alanine-synthesizing transaminase